METHHKTEPAGKQNNENPSTENASKNGTRKSNKGSTKKRNLRTKIAKERTADVFELAANALNQLAKKSEETEIKDRDIIKRNISKILELKNNGVALESVYEVLKSSTNLTISVSSFRNYVSGYAAELVGKGKKRISIVVPEEHVESVNLLAAGINHGVPVVCISFENGSAKGRIDFGKVPPIKVDLAAE